MKRKSRETSKKVTDEKLMFILDQDTVYEKLSPD